MVVDASLLTSVLLGHAQAVLALEEESEGREQEPLHAPELIEPETLQALRRCEIRGEVEAERANEAIRDLSMTRLARYPHAPLRDRVWELRHNLTAYEASYLALAEILEATVLLTADGGLARIAGRSLGSSRVRQVA